MKTTRKKIPQRTCVACGRVTAKRELVRLVHTTDSRVEVDTEGRKAGRGAYLCRAPDCWENGIRGNRLERALRITLGQDNRKQLISYGKGIGQGAK